MTFLASDAGGGTKNPAGILAIAFSGSAVRVIRERPGYYLPKIGDRSKRVDP
jgi:hypothetical protein